MDASVPQQPPHITYLKDYQPPAFRIETLDLTFHLERDATKVINTMVLARQAGETGDLVLDLDHAVLLQSLSLDGTPLAQDRWYRDSEQLTITAVPEQFTLTIETEIDPGANTRLEGLYLTKNAYCTQCEAEGFRHITAFLDRPDVMTVYTVRIEADKVRCPVLLSNGNCLEAGDLAQGRHYAVWHDPFPKPCYLFALVAGDLSALEDHFTTGAGRKVKLAIWAEAKDLPKCRHAMDSLKRAMAWDEQVYGLEYDLDEFNIVAVSDFNMGAMENKSLNIFNTKFILADEMTATDDDFHNVESVVAHEYFHNWTGNRVTCRDWFQLSLKEGLTVFRDQSFSADMGSAGRQRIADVRALRAAQFPEDAGPLAHPVRPESYIEINNFYTATVYNKGAEVIRMMHTLLGAEGYRRGMDLYFQRHDGQAVRCEDFAAAMEDANGADLTQFRLWYAQAGTPKLLLNPQYDARAQTLTLTVQQDLPKTPGQKNKQPMHIPLSLALFGSDGAPITAQTNSRDITGKDHGFLLNIRQSKQDFVFHAVVAEPIVSPLRGFSAPVIVEKTTPFSDYTFLMTHEHDAFARWEASQQAATSVILSKVDEPDDTDTAEHRDALVQAFADVLDDEQTDPALRAEMLTLPSDVYLGEQMNVVEVDGIFAARQKFRKRIGQTLRDRLTHIYETFVGQNDAGARRLKNLAMAYLAAAGDMDRALAQYETSENMTDRQAALQLVVDSDHAERAQVIDDFYQRFKDEDLVVDKWFTAQAISIRPDTLEIVKTLMAHPAFTLRNPNRLRALIGAFAHANQIRFHEASGEGYVLLGEVVAELNAMNPQTAARMVTPLTRWRRFDEARRAKMKLQLKKLVDKPGISPDVYEIASKSLT